MVRIKIKDLPDTQRVSHEELRRVMGGGILVVNTLSVLQQSSGGIAIVFPDVCLTPTTGGPISIPYPNIGSTSDISTASVTKIDGTPVKSKG